ncbi:MAG: HlyD family secretion protein [Methanosarcina sp.]
MFFAIIMAILAICWFIKSPDVVNAPVTITTYNPPASLVARSGGEIGRFFVTNGEKVYQYQPVALIGNQAEWNDIRSLEIFIASIGDSIDWKTFVNNSDLPSGLFLGELQDQWLGFMGLLIKFRDYLQQAYIPAKLELLDKQIARQEEYVEELKHQETLSKEDLSLTYNSYKRDSNLYHRSSYSISVNEFEQSKQALLQKQVIFSSLKSSVKNNESSILKIKETKLDLSNQYQKEINQYLSDLNVSLQLLEVELGKWKEKYLLQSPFSGKITFTSFWIENQVINSGEILATIIPDDPQKVLVRARVPIAGSGKVKPGQAVNIKLTGYPFMENGVLRGRISSLSLVPVHENYLADIDLTNGMMTSYGVKLEFIDGMTGTADIITENRRLIYRFVKPLQSILRN